jgi:Protein of unknown function (DUF3108)
VRPWLVASVLVHGIWLAPTPHPPLTAPHTQGGPLQLRMLPPPATPAPLEPQLPPVQTPAVKPGPAAARAAESPPFAAAEGTAAPTAWPANGRWHYQLSWRGEAGEAVIDWQVDGDRYRLRLERQTGSRALPVWLSEGQLDGSGLQPARFSAGHAGREHTRWRFSAGQLLPQRGEAQALPPGTQDRLSWIWQLAHQAQQLQPRPGERLQLVVAAWRGAPQTWELLAERDPDHPLWLRLRRLAPEGSLAEQQVWLDPARGHLLVRLDMRYDDAERWSLRLVDAPPVAAPAPSSP